MKPESSTLEAIEKELRTVNSVCLLTRLRSLVAKFKGRGADLLTPCRHIAGSQMTCWIAWYLPEMNEVLWQARMHITEHTPGSFTLSAIRGIDVNQPRPDSMLLEGAVLAYLLLKRHRCITRLELGTRAVMVFSFPSLLSKALEGNSALTEAHIGYDYEQVVFRSPHVPAVVSKTVAKLSLRLESLDATNLVLGKEAMNSIAKAVKEGKLCHLFLYNGMSTKLVVKLFLAISTSSNLTSLQFDGLGEFSMRQAFYFSGALIDSKTLRKLSIHCLGEDVVGVILGALEYNDSLEELSLGDAGFSSFSILCDGIEALCKNKRLKSVTLSNVRLPDRVAPLIADVLLKNKSIEELCLPANDLTDAGAAALAEALPRNSSLRRLDLSGCGLSADSLSRFSEALARNNTAECVRLGMIDVPEDWVPSSPLTMGICARLQVTWNTHGLEGWAACLRQEKHPFDGLCVSWMKTAAPSAVGGLFSAVDPSSITELAIDFPGNIKPACGEVVASFLHTTKTLRKLVLKDTDRSPRFVAEVIKGIALNRTVREAHLVYSLRNDGCVKALALMLRENRTLQRLKFRTHYLEDSALCSLARALEDNFVLLALDFRFVTYGGDISPVLSAVDRNRSLLNRAVECVLKDLKDVDSLRALRLLSTSDSLVDSVALVSGKPREECELLVAESVRRLESSTDT
ncbi:uncharacterized protein LOC144106491 [Amblyomma americanum]